MKGARNGNAKDAAGKQASLEEGFDAPFRGFVNVDLTPAQKEAFDGWYEDTDIPAWMTALCRDGVVLSVKRDKKSEGFMASATQRREGSINAGLAVTMRSSEASVALQRILYALALLPEGDWERGSRVNEIDPW